MMPFGRLSRRAERLACRSASTSGLSCSGRAERFPTSLRGLTSILTYPQYWAFRLSGVRANEATSLGCHTDLWNFRARDFSSLVDRMGWRELMAPVRRADESLGPILPEIAVATGLAADTPVLCGIHDSNASLLPHLIGRATPFSVVSTGTWVISMAIGDADIELDPARDTLVNVNAFGEPVPSARFMGGREFETLLGDRPAQPSDADVEAVLAEQILLTPSVQQGSGPFAGRQAEWVGGEPQWASTHRGGVVLSGDDDGDRTRADRGEGTDDRRRPVRRQCSCSRRCWRRRPVAT